jgi:hypothetical protein
VKVIQRIYVLLLLSALTGQACNQAAKPRDAAKPEAAKPQNAASPQDAAKPQPTKTAKISLIEAGDIYDEGVSVKNGERWLGLYVTEGGSSLAESMVTVKPLLDPEDKTQVIGKIVGVDNPVKPVFLVKGAATLGPGPASTIYRGGEEAEHELVNTENLASRKPRQLKLGDQQYQLKVLTPKARPGETSCPECVDLKLALVFGEQTQTLYSMEDLPSMESLEMEIRWYLLWAGDADGDGKVDLYVSFSYEGGPTHTELFLSAQAEPGQLVKGVATFNVDVP